MDTTKQQQASSSKLAASPTILSTNDLPPAIPEATPALGEESTMLPPPVPEPRSRPLSLVSKKNNRLSISFPVQPSETMSPGRQTPTQNSAFPSPLVANQSALPSPQDSAGFMQALAGQERKVFELREELNRAEVELKKLKTQWAIHEADKKRAEIRLVRRLEPMQLEDTIQGQATPLGDEDIARRSAELDRRKAILAANVTKVSRRKIITGGHTRALSLLSPDRSPNGQYPSFDTVERSTDSFDVGPGLPAIPRKLTMPDTSQGLSRITSDRARHSYQGSTTIGVKQIAEDLKAGLWTFMEDLRQATVGEDALERSPIGDAEDPRTVAGTGGTKKANQGLITKKSTSRDRGTASTSKSVPVSRTKNTGQQSLLQTQPAQPSTPPPNKTTMSTSTVDDDWSNWDSPSSKEASPRWSNSTMPSSDDAREAGKPW
jgi:ribosomal protein L29